MSISELKTTSLPVRNEEGSKSSSPVRDESRLSQKMIRQVQERLEQDQEEGQEVLQELEDHLALLKALNRALQHPESSSPEETAYLQTRIHDGEKKISEKYGPLLSKLREDGDQVKMLGGDEQEHNMRGISGVMGRLMKAMMEVM